MARSRQRPVALTIAGSDSGGGAGIQADLKTFAAFGVHGTAALTCVTAQNPARVRAIEPCSPAIVRAQIEAVFAGLPPAAIKTGMLYSEAIIRVVAGCFRHRERRPLIVDPVLVSTSGTRLMQKNALAVLKHSLLPRALLVTPNVPEAEVLMGRPLKTVDDLRQAARAIRREFGCAALVKGGHLPGTREAVDVFFDGREELLLSAPFIRGVKTHGTGCTYSAAITAGLALGNTLPAAVTRAKAFVTRAIANRYRVSGNDVLNPES